MKKIHYLDDYNLPSRGRYIDFFGKLSEVIAYRFYIRAYLSNSEICYYNDSTSFPRSKEEILDAHQLVQDPGIRILIKLWIDKIEKKFNRERILDEILE